MEVKAGDPMPEGNVSSTLLQRQYAKQEETIADLEKKIAIAAHDKMLLARDTDPMNDITREEFNARMETIEVKMDARVESVSAKIDAFIAVQAERDKRMEAIVNQISTTHAEIKTSINSMKTTTIVTAVSAVLAIVIGIAGFNAMLTSNMIASFQMGRSESALAASAVQSSQKAEQETPSSAQKK